MKTKLHYPNLILVFICLILATSSLNAKGNSIKNTISKNLNNAYKLFDNQANDLNYNFLNKEISNQTSPRWISSKIVKANVFVGAKYVETLSNEVINKINGLIYSKISGPSWLIVNADGSLSGTPSITDIGLNSFSVNFKNGINTVTTNLLINVFNSNHSQSIDEVNKFEVKANITVYGKKNPLSSQLKNIYQQSLLAEDDLDIGNFESAKSRITPIMNQYPLLLNPNPAWNGFSNWGGSIFPNFAGNTPHGYVHAGIINEILKIRDQNINNTAPLKVLTLTVVLMNYASYPKPDGSGNEIVALNPEIKTNNYEKVRRQFNLLSHYIYAITNGQAKLHIQFVEVNDNLVYKLNTSNNTLEAGYGIGIGKINKNIRDSSDLFCEIIPWKPTTAAFANVNIRILGGMGGYGGKNKYRAVFIPWSTDYFLEPGYLKARFYGAEWAQHEFFHHVFRTFSSLNLEDTDHKWFDRSKWPSNFLGSYEGDYYIESLNKAIKPSGQDLYESYNQGLVENTPPQWIANQINTREVIPGFQYSGGLSSFVKDVDNHPLTFKKISGPAWLNVSIDGVLTGIPSITDNALNSFVIAVDDGFSVPIETRLNIFVKASCLQTAPFRYAKLTNNSATTVLTCNSPSISLTASGGVSYIWDNNLGQNANITINKRGIYTVSIMSADGCADTESIEIFDENIVATCAVSTTRNNLDLNSGVTNVKLNTINKTTSTFIPTSALQDFVCSNNTTLNMGSIYNFSVTYQSRLLSRQFLEVWIDWDNNGIFETSNSSGVNERVLADNIGFNTTKTAVSSVNPPLTAVLNRMLRMRVISEIGTAPTRCGLGDARRADDYGIIVANTTLSKTDFSTAGFEIYPNPVKDFLTISLKNNEAIEDYSIYDATGKKVLSGSKTDNNVVDTSGLTVGLYFIKIKTTTGELNSKFLKE